MKAYKIRWSDEDDITPRFSTLVVVNNYTKALELFKAAHPGKKFYELSQENADVIVDGVVE